MTIEKTSIDDLFILDYSSFQDKRGEFVKTMHAGTFKEYGIDHVFEEIFFSVSNSNVIRGMHFQVPPDDHSKLVYVISGKILDVVVDIRKESKTYGQHFSIELTGEKRQGLYIGKGLAHGFISLQENSVVEYHTTTAHSAQNETGVRYDSFGFDWGVNEPVISDRDLNFASLKDYKSPF